jgi:hypothetical protein
LGVLSISPAAICITNIVFTGWFEIVLGLLLLALIASCYFTKLQIQRCQGLDEEGLSLRDRRGTDVVVDYGS